MSAILSALAALVPAASAHADRVGVRAGLYTDLNKPFVGVELLSGLSPRVYFNPNVEYVFIDHLTYLTFNGDFHYDFHSHRRTFAWVGGGLAVIYQNPEGPADGSTDVGANFIFGIGFKGDVIPYFQAKLIAKENTELAVAFGLRF